MILGTCQVRAGTVVSGMGGTAPGEADCLDWEMKNWLKSSSVKSVVALGKVCWGRTGPEYLLVFA